MMMLLMDGATAKGFRVTVDDRDGRSRLDPRLIDAGPYAGSWVLPARVLDDPAFEHLSDQFGQLKQVDLDTDEAWPPEKE